ncbi:MAG: hypothetical protein ACYCPN_01520 [Thermoplasmata archaeon]
MYADPDRLTTVSVRLRTLQNLRKYKVGGASLDDVLIELMENYPPESFWEEIRRREKEPDLDAEEVFRRVGLRP